MPYSNKVFFGDCRESMCDMIGLGIKAQTCVTSPPYFGLRDYGHPGQLGLESTVEEYVANLVTVFRLVREVLADDGVLFLNLGDSYFGGGRGGNPESSPHQKQRTNRGTVSMPASARYAAACGTSGKELADSLSRDCLCGNLCDACRRAYLIGKSHSDYSPVPTQEPLLCVTSRERRESPSDHLPTLDLATRANHSEAAIPAVEHSLTHAHAPLPAFGGSMPSESSRPLPVGSRLLAQLSECRLCGCSFERCAQESADSSACTCGIESPSDSLGEGKKGRAYLDSAYRYSTTNPLKQKDLIGIPWRVALALQADGWYLRQDIIWAKPNPMPESVTDRCTKSHEYLFMLTKNARYYFDSEAIKEPATSGPAGTVKKDQPRRMNATPLYQSNRGGQSQEPVKSGAMGIPEDGKRNRRSVWTISTKPYKGAHFATFPPELVEPCVLAGSRVGDIVFDPFLGSGTTAMVAARHGRRWIGCELNEEYGPLQEERLLKA
jgi:DNA modification methylase